MFWVIWQPHQRQRYNVEQPCSEVKITAEVEERARGSFCGHRNVFLPVPPLGPPHEHTPT